MLTNASQVIERNIELLNQGDGCLVAGLPADDLLQKLPLATGFTWDYSVFRYMQQRNYPSLPFSAEMPKDQIYQRAIIFVPKSREEFRLLLLMLSPLLAENGEIFLVGEKKEGIATAAKSLSDFCSDVEKIDMARHCQLWRGQIKGDMQQPFELSHLVEISSLELSGQQLQVASLPGVFSHGRLDQGTELMLESMSHFSSGRVLDFGCGCGVVGAFTKLRKPAATLVLADCNALSIYCSRKTLELNALEGEVMATDGWSDLRGRFHAIITNPPFHAGVDTYYATTENFIKQSGQNLIPGGYLTLVANAFLKYPPIIEQVFGHCRVLMENTRFRVYQAQKRN